MGTVDVYLRTERGDPATAALWVGTRRGRGRPLSYPAFGASLHQLGARVGVPVTAHMFRHTVATGLVTTAGVAVAQQVLGHRHVGTTLDSYVHVDREAMARAVAAVADQARAARADRPTGPVIRYAFAYDPATIAELDALATPRIVTGADR